MLLIPLPSVRRETKICWTKLEKGSGTPNPLLLKGRSGDLLGGA